MAKEIRIERACKVFGDDPGIALKLVRQGVSKQEVLARTGCSVGVVDASLTIGAGEVFVLMGLSGSGKSTLLRLLNLLIEPTEGRIRVDGTDISALSPAQLRAMRRQDMGMVFQSFALMPHMTVLENTAFGLELAGVGRAARETQALQALETVGLAGRASSYPEALSGGMQQRVGLARALALDPGILLMDEAFSSLDPIIRTEMQTELLRLQKVKRRTIVFVSHSLDEAMRIGDRIAIMKDGRVIQVGTPDEILRNPADEFVCSFTHGVDAAAVFKAADIARKTQVVVSEHPHRGSRAALKMLEEMDREYGYVVSPAQQYLGMVSVESLRAVLHGHANPVGLAQAFVPDVQPVASDASVNNLYGQVAHASYALPVVDEAGQFFGTISKTTLLKFLDRDTPAVPVRTAETSPP